MQQASARILPIDLIGEREQRTWIARMSGKVRSMQWRKRVQRDFRLSKVSTIGIDKYHVARMRQHFGELRRQLMDRQGLHRWKLPGCYRPRDLWAGRVVAAQLIAVANGEERRSIGTCCCASF
jgi:hypothetical protein